MSTVILIVIAYIWLSFCIAILANRYKRSEGGWFALSLLLSPAMTLPLLLAKGNIEKQSWTIGIEGMMTTMSQTMHSMDSNAKAQRDVLCEILCQQPDK